MGNRHTLLIISLMLLALTGCSKPSPEVVTQSYWQAVLNADSAAVADYVLDPQARGPESYFNAVSHSSVNTGEAIIEGDKARVPTQLQLTEQGEARQYQTTTLLTRRDERWQVDSVATRRALVRNLFNDGLQQLQTALAQSAEELNRLGEQALQEVVDDLAAAQQTMAEDADQASQELDAFLQQLDRELVEILKDHGSEPQPAP